MNFQDSFKELDSLEPQVDHLVETGQELMEHSPESAASTLSQNLHNLQTRWANIKDKAADRRAKLEEAVKNADHFHKDLNAFIVWLTNTEKTLNNLRQPSCVLDTVRTQIEQHQQLQKDISGKRETSIALDQMGTHLKLFSQKQDVVLIKNLLVSVQHRWEKVVSRSADRTRQLDHGYKQAKKVCKESH